MLPLAKGEVDDKGAGRPRAGQELHRDYTTRSNAGAVRPSDDAGSAPYVARKLEDLALPDAMSRDATIHHRSAETIKVPARITALFWVIKLLTTGTGEAASDYLGTLPLVLAAVVAAGGFGGALWWQLRSPAYRPAVYWLAVTMVAVFGTAAADGVHVALGVPYFVSTLAWAVVVAAVLRCWYRREGGLSVHSITTAVRERFYWATVLSTFALGTAAGDLTASELNLGFLPSAALFAALIAIPLIAWRAGWIGDVLGFWAAYVLTRPLGASLADWFGKPHSVDHGLGLGDGTVAGTGLLAIAALVGGLEWASRRDPDRSVSAER